jgi:hypothetical protein
MRLLPQARHAIESVDPELVRQDVQPLTELVRGSWARPRFAAILFGPPGSPRR